MNPLHKFGLIIIGLSVSFLACKHEPENPTDPGGGGNPITCSPDSVYFGNQIQPLLLSNCAMPGCHDNGTQQDGVNFSSYTAMMNSGVIAPGNPGNSDLWEAINETDPDKRMPPPPAAPLTTDQKNMIYAWIMQGAQNNTCNSGCDSSQFTFAAVIQPLINQKCKGCHSGANPSGSVSLETHAQIAAVANDGRLVGVITGVGYTKMPLNGQLPDCEITQITNWVNAGAPNN